MNRTGTGGGGVANPLEIPDWDRRLQAFPSATVFHTAAWARVLRDTYGYTPVYFIDGAPDRPRALLPFMEVNSWLTGRRGVSLPFTDHCEPLAEEPGAFAGVLQQVETHARSRAWRYWECRGGRRWFGREPASIAFWGHRLDLQESEAARFMRLDGAARRAVRKAAKSGLTVEFSRSLAAVATFYRLLGRTRRRHGIPVQPFKFFANIQRHVLEPGRGLVILARRGQEPIAGAIFFHQGKEALYKFGASDERHQQLRGNNLVMWEAIRHFAGLGFASLDFGRTSLGNEGLRHFKLGWGATEHSVEYFRRDRHAAGFSTVADRSSGWHNRIFRTLPVFLSRLIGAILYKHTA